MRFVFIKATASASCSEQNPFELSCVCVCVCVCVWVSECVCLCACMCLSDGFADVCTVTCGCFLLQWVGVLTIFIYCVATLPPWCLCWRPHCFATLPCWGSGQLFALRHEKTPRRGQLVFRQIWHFADRDSLAKVLCLFVLLYIENSLMEGSDVLKLFKLYACSECLQLSDLCSCHITTVFGWSKCETDIRWTVQSECVCTLQCLYKRKCFHADTHHADTFTHTLN